MCALQRSPLQRTSRQCSRVEVRRELILAIAARCGAIVVTHSASMSEMHASKPCHRLSTDSMGKRCRCTVRLLFRDFTQLWACSSCAAADLDAASTLRPLVSSICPFVHGVRPILHDCQRASVSNWHLLPFMQVRLLASSPTPKAAMASRSGSKARW